MEYIVTGTVIEIVPTEVQKHEAGYWRKMIDRKIEEARKNGV
ncbi:hypothetical protein [Lactobacillus sp. UCMA15818]|nr:hypothetical protein [Lactobacillus sp. UCMA15818]